MLVLSLVALSLLPAGLLYQAVASAADRRRYPPPGILIDIGTRRLHCRCEGSGSPPVIFESGVAASSINWTLVQAEVGRLTRTCSYDRAGLAWSDALRDRRTAEGLMEDLRVVIERCTGTDPVVLVGHSFGTFIVRGFAACHPDKVAGLVFVDPISPSEWIAMSAAQRRMLQGGVLFSRIGAMLARVGVVRACLSLLAGGRTAVPRAVARGFGGEALRVLTNLIGEVQKMPAEMLPVIRAHWSQPKSFSGMAAYLACLPAVAADVAGAHVPAEIPVTVLSAGDLDPAMLAEHAALARASRDGRHIVAEHCGHWIQLDEPDLVVRAIRPMVDGR
ncbi:MAG: alpha/beta hydrolase [Acidobacteria bacterium]|nr:alpha/beta hydrolase [Acidobacteriota bacterium]MBI3262365.1 alpha/beta hydrolase [Acidobacteriota bacterium]